MLFLVNSDDLALTIKNDKPGAARALVYGTHIFGHLVDHWRLWHWLTNMRSSFFRFPFQTFFIYSS